MEERPPDFLPPIRPMPTSPELVSCRDGLAGAWRSCGCAWCGSPVKKTEGRELGEGRVRKGSTGSGRGRKEEKEKKRKKKKRKRKKKKKEKEK